MVKKSFRELLRMAEDEGVEDAWVDYGTPHDRLVGTVDGDAFEIVISRNCLDAPKRRAMARANIRREVTKMKHAALMALAARMIAEEAKEAAA